MSERDDLTRNEVETTSDMVLEQYMGGKYRMPDESIDLDSWLRDFGPMVNFMMFMKPMFFEMLDALGGEFKVPHESVNANRRARRLRLGVEEGVYVARLETADPAASAEVLLQEANDRIRRLTLDLDSATLLKEMYRAAAESAPKGVTKP